MGERRYSLREPALVAAEIHTYFDEEAILELINYLLQQMPPERYGTFIWKRGCWRDPERVIVAVKGD